MRVILRSYKQFGLRIVSHRIVCTSMCGIVQRMCLVSLRKVLLVVGTVKSFLTSFFAGSMCFT